VTYSLGIFFIESRNNRFKAEAIGTKKPKAYTYPHNMARGNTTL
jgi:hypothetical protein